MTAAVLLASAVAAYFDVRWRRVPNWLVLLLALASLAWHAASGSFAASAAGLGLGLLLLFPLFVLRGLGAGDVKFVAALGAAVTYRQLPSILLLATLLAATLSLVLCLRRGLLGRTLRNVVRLGGALVPGARREGRAPSIDSPDALLVPFTFAAAAATWLVLLAARG